MTHLKAALGLGALALLAACETIPGLGGTETAALPPGGDACGAAARQDLVGQSVAVLNTADLPEGRRIIFPGMAVNMDFQAERLNIEVGQNDRIARVFCG